MRKNEIDSVFPEQAQQFNTWFSKNVSFLIDDLKNELIFDDDVFNESYLKMYENIFFTGKEVLNYRSYFMRSYFTNRINLLSKENRYCDMILNYDADDSQSAYFDEMFEKEKKLESDIFDYVYQNYDLREFELFKMYMHLKPAVNYNSLSKITKIKAYIIHQIISKIKKDILSNEDFRKQRSELL